MPGSQGQSPGSAGQDTSTGFRFHFLPISLSPTPPGLEHWAQHTWCPWCLEMRACCFLPVAGQEPLEHKSSRLPPPPLLTADTAGLQATLETALSRSVTVPAGALGLQVLRCVDPPWGFQTRQGPWSPVWRVVSSLFSAHAWGPRTSHLSGC